MADDENAGRGATVICDTDVHFCHDELAIAVITLARSEVGLLYIVLLLLQLLWLGKKKLWSRKLTPPVLWSNHTTALHGRGSLLVVIACHGSAIIVTSFDMETALDLRKVPRAVWCLCLLGHSGSMPENNRITAFTSKFRKDKRLGY